MILVTGATGFIGLILVRQLLAERRRVIVLTRDVLQARASFGDAVWSLDRLQDIPAETPIEAVIHLAGAPVMGWPWTQHRRRVLLESRIGITRDLLSLVERLQSRPRVLVAASAVGYYGVPSNSLPMDETSLPQPGRFQSDLCARIEDEARRAEALGLRVVLPRFGIVLGRHGGALPALAAAARLGLASRIAGGSQPMPWIHVDDACGLVRFAIQAANLHGPVNAVAPDRVTQIAFAESLAATFGWAGVWLRVPGWALRAALGEMSELLCCGQAAVPKAALEAGYAFRYPLLADALRNSAHRDPEQ